MDLRHAAREEPVYEGPQAARAFLACRALLWSYRFYPASLVQAAFETPTGGPAPGAVLHQRIRLGPLRFRGPVRVLDVRDEPDRAGYRYEALAGHVERGVAGFELRRAGASVVFRVESDSAPAHWLARLAPSVARAVQRRAVDGAFAAMRAAAREAA